MFNHSEQTLRDVCAQALELAKAGGATAAEADVSESIGQSVQVRLQEIEHIEYQQDKSLDLTVYVGRRKGRASTADFSAAAIADTVRAALDIARYTAEDPCAGLAEAALMATEFPDLQSYHEWPLSTAEAKPPPAPPIPASPIPKAPTSKPATTNTYTATATALCNTNAAAAIACLAAW